MSEKKGPETQPFVVPIESPSRSAVAVGQRRPALVAMAGSHRGAIYVLKIGDTIIGRERGCDLEVDDDHVSRRHTRVKNIDNRRCLVEDEGSRNGSFVNNQRVTSVELREGDRIQLGPGAVFRFSYVDDLDERVQRDVFQAAVRDPLTAAYNRRYLYERLGSDFSYARRHKSSLALLLLDLDHFKRVNDEHGHHVGDEVLKMFTARATSTIRTEDVFARYGGEEFAVLCAGEGAIGATRLAERLRQAVSAVPIEVGSLRITITVSIGVAVYPDDGNIAAAQGLVSSADEALMLAKRMGRDRAIMSHAMPRAPRARHTAPFVLPNSRAATSAGDDPFSLE